MELAYTHDVVKFADAGLNLNLPPDLVPPTQYPTFSNAISFIEGQVGTREGTTLVCMVGPATNPVHSIFRLVQVIPSILGARLFGVGTQLWVAPLPAGNVPAQLTAYLVANTLYPSFPISYSGAPLSIAAYRFDGDPQIWAIIANGAKMMKYKAGYYEQLGLPAPTVVATASAGGSGNLNSLGVPYDWRYTYVNSVTLSESDPSPTMMSTAATTISPNAYTTPDTSIGSSQIAFTNPANAYDGDPTTYATALVPAAQQTASCRWYGWTNSGGPYASLTLQVLSSAFIQSLSGGVARVQLQYSLDGGSTWNTIYQIQVTSGSQTRGQQTDSVTIPSGADLTQLIVRSIVFGQPNSTATTNVYEISIAAQPSGGGSGAIDLDNQSAIICVTPPTDPQEDTIRLYRRGGTLVDNWWLTVDTPIASLSQGVCGVGTLEIDDNNSDASIEANNTLALDNDMPVTSVQTQNQTLQAIWVYNARVLGCGDPNRPEAVYFSKDGNADEWPPENWIVVSTGGDEMMNGIVYASRCYAWSRERLWTLLPNLIQGVTFSPFPTSCRKGLKGRFAFCEGEKGLYFVAKDGIYITQGGDEQSITDATIRPLFPTFDGPGKDTGAYFAPDLTQENALRLAYHNGEIWFDYLDTHGNAQTLIYDERRTRWRGYFAAGALATSNAATHYDEPDTTSSLLTGTDANAVLQGGSAADPGPTAISVDVLTGSYDQSQPLNLKEYGNVIFDLDPGGATSGSPVTITPYINANAITEAAITVTGSGRQRVALPLADVSTGRGLYGLNISFGVTWAATSAITPILYQMDILWRIEPSAMRHWEVPPVALGQSGWFHMRDAYVTLRSGAAVVMTLTPDNGAQQTFTLPSTSGAKQKLYVPFAANKVKVCEFAFDSTADFRLYSDECELRAKQWLTKLGYQVLPFFGAETK